MTDPVFPQAFLLIGPRNLGRTKINRMKIPNQPIDILYVCPFCGETWAKLLTYEEGTLFSFFSIPCPKHGGGSLLKYIDPPLTKEYLLHELEIFSRDLPHYRQAGEAFFV